MKEKIEKKDKWGDDDSENTNKEENERWKNDKRERIKKKE